MKHYSKASLIEYINDTLAYDIKLEIEKHLLSCDECINAYLTILEEMTINKNDKQLSGEFVNNVMDAIDSMPINSNLCKSLKETRQARRKMFAYYTAAACITLFLMGSGAFSLVFKMVPSTTAAIVESPIKMEASLGKIRLGHIINTNLKLNDIFKGEK